MALVGCCVVENDAAGKAESRLSAPASIRGDDTLSGGARARQLRSTARHFERDPSCYFVWPLKLRGN